MEVGTQDSNQLPATAENQIWPLDGLVGTPVAVSARSDLPPLQIPAAAYIPPVQTRAIPCIYFLKGICTKGDRCLYMHEQQPIGDLCTQQQNIPQVNIKAVEVPDTPHLQTGAIPCIYFLKGICTKGDRCPYMHEQHPIGNLCTQQQNIPQVNIKPVEVRAAAKPAETAPPTNEVLGDFPPTISGQALSSGKVADEFLGESSPGLDDELIDSDNYNDEDEFGKITSHEGKHLNSVPRAENPNQINNGSRSAVSPDRHGNLYQRDCHVEEQRIPGGQFQTDPRQLPHESSGSQFSSNRSRSSGAKLEFIEPSLIDGKKVAVYSSNEVEDDIRRWDSTLIGNVLGWKKPPPFAAIRRFVQRNWGKFGHVEIFLLDSGLILFRFSESEACQQVLDQGPWSFQRKPLILNRWTPSVSMGKPLVSSIPIWVKFPHLNVHLWNEKVLGGIASTIGKPLFTDKLTAERARLSFARVCIEVSASEELPNEVMVMDQNGRMEKQKVEYEWRPLICKRCTTFGHLEASCQTKQAWVKVHTPSVQHTEPKNSLPSTGGWSQVGRDKGPASFSFSFSCIEPLSSGNAEFMPSSSGNAEFMPSSSGAKESNCLAAGLSKCSPPSVRKNAPVVKVVKSDVVDGLRIHADVLHAHAIEGAFPQNSLVFGPHSLVHSPVHQTCGIS